MTEVRSRPQQRVIDAAAGLFVDHGYAATSVRQIARRAGVSLDTVYACGGKAEIFLAALELVLSGSADGTPLLEGPGMADVWQAGTLREIVAGLVRATVAADARSTGIWSAFVEGARSDATLQAALIAQQDAMREQGRQAIAFLKGRALCDPDVDTARVADLIWAEAHPDRFALLVGHAGWSVEAFSDQLTDTILVLLGGPEARSSERA